MMCRQSKGVKMFIQRILKSALSDIFPFFIHFLFFMSGKDFFEPDEDFSCGQKREKIPLRKRKISHRAFEKEVSFAIFAGAKLKLYGLFKENAKNCFQMSGVWG